MIKITKQDNIFNILYKIEKSKKNKENKIILNFPFWHPVLYNYISLKSIINKIWNKKLIIITNDINSKKIWKQLWIKYSIIKNRDFINDNNQNLLKYNYTFFEYFKYEINKYISFFKKKIFKNQKIIDIKKKYKKQKSNIFIFILMLLIVSLILLYIFFFALNNTTIYITPEIKEHTQEKNFIFNINANSLYKRNNEEKVKLFKDKIKLNFNYKTTGIKQTDSNKAKTTIEFINKFKTEVKLLPHTRLMTSSWILFETTNWVKIPAAIENNNKELIPWIKKATIISKTFDNKWIFIWKRANNSASWILLTLPWLKNNQDKLYAKTLKPITDWKDIYTHIVTKDDLKNSIKILKDKLIKKAVNKLNQDISTSNKTNNVTFKILNINNIFHFTNIKTKIIENVKAWDNIKAFDLSWSINTSVYTYNIDSVISKLTKEINNFIIPWKEKILSINNKSIRISNIIYWPTKPFNMKATVEIEYFTEYNFENEDDWYINMLKNTITWLPKQEAEKILINENKISNAQIKIKPFFLNKVSPFANKIKFIIKD